MGVVIKQSFWGTLMTYVGVAIGYLNTLYVRAEYFELDQIGLFTLITANAMIISSFASFGMSSSFLKYFSTFSERDRASFFSFLLLVAIIGNILVFGICYALQDLIVERYIDSAPAYIEYLFVTAIVIFANSMFELFMNYSRTIMNVVFPVFLREIFLRAGSLLMVLGYSLTWWSFDGAIFGLGIIYTAAFILLSFQLVVIHNLRFIFNFSIISKTVKSNLVKYGTYSMLLAGSFALINNISNDQLTTIVGTSAAGIFNTCFFIAVVVELPRRNMANLIAPILSTEMEKGAIKEVSSLYKRSSITMSVLGSLLFIGITTNLSDLFAYIPQGESFQTGFWVVISVCLAKLFIMLSSFSGEIINFSNFYKFNLLFQVLTAFLLVVLNYLLIPIYGLNGAAISYLSAILFHIILKGTFVWRKFKIHPFVSTHFKLFLIACSVGIVAFLFTTNLHPILSIAIRSISTSILFIALIYQFKISVDINNLIRSTFERVKKIKHFR
ncbi:lipopolysaccharide biosynthesis protein [Ekhidna sp.]